MPDHAVEYLGISRLEEIVVVEEGVALERLADRNGLQFTTVGSERP